MKTDLASAAGILKEIEQIVDGVKAHEISGEEAKIRMWGAKNAIRILALEVFRERFELGTKSIEVSEVSESS